MQTAYSSFLCTHQYQCALTAYRKAKRRTWIGETADVYEAHYEEVAQDLSTLGTLLSQWEAARARLEAML